VSSAAGDRADRWTLIYDGDCEFCRACVRMLARWDRRGRLRFAPLQDAAALACLPPLGREALEGAMHLVSPAGGVWAGALALPPMLRLLPGGRVCAALLAVPGVERTAEYVYRSVARYRHRLGCASAVCPRGR